MSSASIEAQSQETSFVVPGRLPSQPNEGSPGGPLSHRGDLLGELLEANNAVQAAFKDLQAEAAKSDATLLSSGDDSSNRRRFESMQRADDAVSALAKHLQADQVDRYLKNLEAKGETPLSLEAKAAQEDPKWYEQTQPLNLEADATNDTTATNGAKWYEQAVPLKLKAQAAKAWTAVKSTVALEAQEAKHLAANMESLSDGDHVQLLMGGMLLLVTGVAFTAARRARNRKAAEKALEDETYLLMT